MKIYTWHQLPLSLRRLISGGFCAVTLVLIITALDWYFISLIEAEAAQFRLLQSDIAARESERGALLDERSRIRGMADSLKKIEDAFVNSANPLSFIEILEGIARKEHIILKLAQPQKKTNTISMQVTIDGTPSNVFSFLSEMEKLPNQIVFYNFALEQSIEEAAPKSKNIVLMMHIIATIEFLAK